MSITIPSRDLSLTEKKGERERIVEIGISRMKAKCIIGHVAEATFLDLAPQDLGLTSWATPSLIGNVKTSWVRCVLGPQAVIVIYKVLQLSVDPTVANIEFWASGSCCAVHELEMCYSGLPIIKNLAKALMSSEAREVLDRLSSREDAPVSPDFGAPMEAWFSEPILYDPGVSCEIKVMSRRDSPGDYLVLGGYTLERAGTTKI